MPFSSAFYDSPYYFSTEAEVDFGLFFAQGDSYAAL